MSLLDNTQQTEINRPQRKARQLKQSALNVFTTLLSQYFQGISLLHEDETPQAIIDAFEADGNSSVELFTRHGQLGAFLESQKAGSTTEANAKIKPFTVVDNKIKFS